jgi:hypothetical protein
MQNTIPASQIVQVNPGVISAGGNALAMVGLVLTQNTRVPIGTVPSFPTALSVGQYFGTSAYEYTVALDYFNGYLNSTAKPGALLFAQYNGTTPVSAYLRGGAVSALTLTQLQALTGSLNMTVDGMPRLDASLNLASATSFSAAATLIASGLNSNPVSATASSGTIASLVFTAAGTITGTFYTGMVLSGSGVTANTVITGQLTGTVGGAGTYSINISQTVSAEAITGTSANVTVTYDSVSGGFVITSGVTGIVSTVAYCTGTLAASLFLTSATGAVLSQGAAPTTPATFMAGVTALTTNFASFMTMFDPDGGVGNTIKLAFATWNGTQNNEFAYICWDTDITPTLSTQSTTCLGYLLSQANTSGTCLIYDPSDGIEKAAFICGAIASVNFTALNGRVTFAFKSASGLAPGVTNATVGANLLANGYNFYGAYATANQNFTFFYNGSVSGIFKWLDAYVNQIWLNASFQVSLMTLLTNVGSVPYATPGYALIRAACAGPINAGLNFGAFQAGVALSPLQIAEVNAAAGTPIDSVLSSQGWYLQILPAQAPARAARTSPPMTFFYTDAGSVQQITLASIEVM